MDKWLYNNFLPLFGPENISYIQDHNAKSLVYCLA